MTAEVWRAVATDAAALILLVVAPLSVAWIAATSRFRGLRFLVPAGWLLLVSGLALWVAMTAPGLVAGERLVALSVALGGLPLLGWARELRHHPWVAYLQQVATATGIWVVLDQAALYQWHLLGLPASFSGGDFPLIFLVGGLLVAVCRPRPWWWIPQVVLLHVPLLALLAAVPELSAPYPEHFRLYHLQIVLPLTGVLFGAVTLWDRGQASRHQTRGPVAPSK